MPGAGSAIDYNTLSFTLLSFLFKSVSVIGCPINLKVGMPVFPLGSPPHFPPPEAGCPAGLFVGGGHHQDCCQDFARLGSRIHEFAFAQRPFLETASRHKRGCALFPRLR